MNLQKELKAFGLHESETKIYLFLLSFGVASPAAVARGTGIARPHCYGILLSLQEKGLVVYQQHGKRRVYMTNNPDALLRAFDTRRERLARVVPDLRALYVEQKNKPVITFYEGFDRVKEIFFQTLTAEEVYGIGSTKQLQEIDPHFFIEYQKKLREKEVVFHDTLTASSRSSAEKISEIMRGFYDYTLLPARYGEIPTNILVWEDTIALIDLSDPVFGTVLTNAALAKTFRILCDSLKERL